MMMKEIVVHTLKDFRVVEINNLKTRSTYTDDIWVEDEFHPSGDGGYYLDVEKTLEQPLTTIGIIASTSTKLTKGDYFLVSNGEIEMYALTENKLATTKNININTPLSFKEEETALLIGSSFSEGK